MALFRRKTSRSSRPAAGRQSWAAARAAAALLRVLWQGSVWQVSAGLGEGAVPRHPASGKRRQQAALERRLKLPLSAFRGKDTRNFIQGDTPKKFQSIEDQIWKTLEIIDDANSTWDLHQRRGLRFKKLHSKRWQYSVRVNQDYRICFDWHQKSPHPTNMEINNHYDKQ